MPSGIPVVTQKGKDALRSPQADLTARCRSILVQVNGKRSLDDIRTTLRGLGGLEDGIARLLAGGYIAVDQGCRDIIKDQVEKQLGAKGAMIARKIDELHAKHGEACWEHLDELDKAARLFYGENLAQNLMTAIAEVLKKTKK